METLRHLLNNVTLPAGATIELNTKITCETGDVLQGLCLISIKVLSLLVHSWDRHRWLMSFGYIGDISTKIKQQVKNQGILSVTELLELEKSRTSRW